MKEYKKKEENHSGAIQPQSEYPEQGSMERVLQRHTGMPDSLKSNMEQLSGYSLDDVQVHYNSSRPAQLQALAYTQGTDIYVGPGQEKHLPHEAWHVVQQKQGRVQPTTQLQGINVNDNDGLEREADRMGYISSQLNNTPVQAKKKDFSGSVGSMVVQCEPLKVEPVRDEESWYEKLDIEKVEDGGFQRTRAVPKTGNMFASMRYKDKQGQPINPILKHYMVAKHGTKYQLPVKHLYPPIEERKGIWRPGKASDIDARGRALQPDPRGYQPEAFGGNQDWHNGDNKNTPAEIDGRVRTLRKEYTEEAGNSASTILGDPVVKKVFAAGWGVGTISIGNLQDAPEGSEMVDLNKVSNNRGEVEMAGTIVIDLSGTVKTKDTIKETVVTKITTARDNLIPVEGGKKGSRILGENAEILNVIIDLIVEDYLNSTESSSSSSSSSTSISSSSSSGATSSSSSSSSAFPEPPLKKSRTDSE